MATKICSVPVTVEAQLLECAVLRAEILAYTVLA